MSSRLEKERAKQIQDKCQNLLAQMLRDEDNKYCVDCDAKGPRWASWNLGIFLCIRCAGIHRNLGVHISKVKSVNLDSWTPEQVVSLQQMGNSRARAVYEANLPDSFRRPQTDCSLESFIRAKYEHKKYIAREWVPPPIPKVNWDKELDEETERQRRRKKDMSKSNINQNVLPPVKKPEVVPQLPKPRSSVSPKPNRITNSNTLDLLGLDTLQVTDAKSTSSFLTSDAPENQVHANGSASGDDIFSSFLSAAPSSNTTAVNGSVANCSTLNAATSKSEEESFFNQPASSSQEKSKMTKDSILALYGTPNHQKQTPVFSAVPGGMYSQQVQQLQQFTSQAVPNNFVQQNNFMASQGAMGQMNSVQPQMVMPVGNQVSTVPNQMGMNVNQSVGNGMQSLGQINGVPNSALTVQAQMMMMGQSNVGNNNGWSGMMLAQNLQPAPGSNPFLNLPPTQQQQSIAFASQLPQQMSQMSLNGIGFPAAVTGKPASTTLPGQTLSTNLWQ